MPTDYIRYDLLVQDALRSVVRKVLGDAARNGLPGEHHFNITFKTQAPGVVIPNVMRERYPEEMAIILQHEFWDLSVTPDTFEVSLNFSRKPERLTVPFDAITAFSDPSVPFGFKLDPRLPSSEAKAASPAAAKPALSAKPAALAPAPKPAASIPAPAKSQAADKSGETDKAEKKPTEKETDGAPAKVVSIDAFRKK